MDFVKVELVELVEQGNKVRTKEEPDPDEK